MNMLNEDSYMSFAELTDNYEIQIPLIQRDYVQGRVTDDKAKEKRDNFVSKLMMALISDDKLCNLDFIYGGRENFGNGNEVDKNAPFLPLDGQQRLTTLFLLHWLLLQKNASVCGRDDKWKGRLQNLAKFSYKTRISSGRFCKKLVETMFESDEPLIGQIKKKYWYDDDMKCDPTIQAMMEMLKQMELLSGEEPYSSKLKEMLDNLYDPHKCRITFDLLDMDRYNLTDGLYIKMNARGKELTQFENWKADFIDMLSDDKNAMERFSYSIEHEWNDVFWKIAYQKYVDEVKRQKEKGNSVSYPKIDEAFMHFFGNITRMLFFIANQNSNVEEYKANLWSTVYKLYKDGKDIRGMLFDILDTLHYIDTANGDLQKFFDSIFVKEEESKNYGYKVLLFDWNLNLFEEACNSDNFSANHILLYALLLYCMRHKVYIANERLCNYIRFCRNYLYEHNYFDTSNVTIAPQVRVNEIGRYFKFFEALVVDVDPLASLQKMPSDIDEYAEREKKKVAYYTVVVELVRKLEDLPYTYGNLSAFVSVLDKCIADNTYCEKVSKAVNAFVDAPALKKVQLFVALGYYGIDVRNCAYGKAVFLGSEFKGVKRWMVHFRRKYDSISPLDGWMMKYVESYTATGGDIDMIIAQHTPANKTLVAYYMLNYPDALAAQVNWNGERDKAPFYFAMKNRWADMDMITIHSFSNRPLNNAFQVCPMVNAAIHKIVNFKKYNEGRRIGYAGQHSYKQGIVINEAVNRWDKIIFGLSFAQKEWKLRSGCYDKLPNSLQKELSQIGDEYVLNMTDDKDLIQVAVDFINRVIEEFEQRRIL